MAASRTFDVTIKLKEGRGEHQFSNVNREEQGCLEDFLKLKGIKVKNEMMEDVSRLLISYASAALFVLSNLANQFYSMEHYLQRHSRTSQTAMMRLLVPTVDQQMRMKRAPTMTSKRTVTLTLQRSLTANMTVVVAVMMM